MNRLLPALALFLIACGRREPKPQAEAPAAKPAPSVRYRGSAATEGGLHLDVSIAADGGYTVFFMDRAGEDLPAAQLANVAVEALGRRDALAINDTGESWVGLGTLPSPKDPRARVTFSLRGQADSAAVTLNSIAAPLDYVCPMDPDVRSPAPGSCPRCGMKLVMGIPDPEEYPLDLDVAPARFHAGEKVELQFRVEHPATGKMVDKFEIVHERLFHLFIVSSDLKYFVHDHPTYDGAGKFHFPTVFPKPGMYRVLGDFYPSGGTPQLAPKTIFVPGGAVSMDDAKLAPDLAAQKGRNSSVELTMDTPHAVAGAAAHLSFHLRPGDELEKYLGAWAHMLAASDDLVDLMHEHPYDAQNGVIEFDMTFPRARIYRVWIQFQRKGVVNTVAFNVPVQAAQP